MHINELQPVIVALYNANITGAVWGQPGIGKSDSFRAAAEVIAREMGLTGPVLERHEIAAYVAAGHDIKQAFGMFDVRLGQSDPVDIGGLPRENKETGAMERLVPDWFPHAGRKDLPDFGILLLDEFPTAPPSVQSAAYQITLDYVIGDKKMKEGWGCFLAGNRVTDGGQFFKMAHAQANRLCHIDVESGLNSWVDWAIDHGIDPSLIACIRFEPDMLNTYEVHIGAAEDKHGKKGRGKGYAFATERTWFKFDQFLKNNPNATDEVICAVGTGLLGAASALSYIGFRQTWQNMPPIQTIFIDPDSAMLPEDAGTQFAVCTALAAQVSVVNLPNALQYVDRFTAMGRSELAVLFIKDMQRRATIAQKKAQDEGVPFVSPVTSPAYGVWTHKNQDLF